MPGAASRANPHGTASAPLDESNVHGIERALAPPVGAAGATGAVASAARRARFPRESPRPRRQGLGESATSNETPPPSPREYRGMRVRASTTAGESTNSTWAESDAGVRRRGQRGSRVEGRGALAPAAREPGRAWAGFPHSRSWIFVELLENADSRFNQGRKPANGMWRIGRRVFLMAEHELFDFLKASSETIQREYERIARRSSEDPGTAGDEGEENWRELLTDWLPPTYHVQTKGRLLFQNGSASPQIDVLVLSPEYPDGLVKAGKKLYLAGGVLAAFECKMTLRQEHLSAAVETARAISAGLPNRWGSPYRELQRPIIYGLLAHSHEWRKERSNPVENVDRGMRVHLGNVETPRNMLDIVCVSDIGTWTAVKLVPHGHFVQTEDGQLSWEPADHHAAVAGFVRHQPSQLSLQPESFTNVGAMIVSLLSGLARERQEIRPIAQYFQSIPGLAGDAGGLVREWPLDQVLSPQVSRRLIDLDAVPPPLGPALDGYSPASWSEWQ
jgi:hypothetical protein